MTLKIRKQNIVWWPVTVRQPTDGGEVQDCEIDIQYLLIDSSEYQDRKSETMKDVLLDHVLDWRGLIDEDDIPIKFTEYFLDEMLRWPYFAEAVFSGLFEASAGAPAKNSKAGSVG